MSRVSSYLCAECPFQVNNYENRLNSKILRMDFQIFPGFSNFVHIVSGSSWISLGNGNELYERNSSIGIWAKFIYPDMSKIRLSGFDENNSAQFSTQITQHRLTGCTIYLYFSYSDNALGTGLNWHYAQDNNT